MSNPNASPIFGVEIEVFCRVKSEHKAEILRYRANGGEELADYWMDWDFDLTNDEPEDSRFRQAQVRQRGCVKSLLSALIAEAVGEDAGWTVVGDASLREFQLTEPTDARHWCKSPAWFASQGQGLTSNRGRGDHLAAHVDTQEMAKRAPQHLPRHLHRVAPLDPPPHLVPRPRLAWAARQYQVHASTTDQDCKRRFLLGAGPARALARGPQDEQLRQAQSCSLRERAVQPRRAGWLGTCLWRDR